MLTPTYSTLALSKTEKRYVTTTDGKNVSLGGASTNFDASKKYPTLLYCQGGPQSALTQFYS
jgi:dipeptidyl aminopeptidase/acylaminoacyl peptidase